MQKDNLKNFAKFTRKHLCQSLFFNKVASLVLQPDKKETMIHVLSCKFFKNIFLFRIPSLADSVSDKTLSFILDSQCLNQSLLTYFYREFPSSLPSHIVVFFGKNIYCTILLPDCD